MLNRRDLIKAGVGAMPLLAGAGAVSESAFSSGIAAGVLSGSSAESLPWQRQIRRVGQTNMTEHDPAVMDVEAWADYWASLKAGVTFISVTGILAYYQTKVPFHRKGKFLGTRDFFGECHEAARKRGLRIVARMSPDLNWDDAVAAHPEWFERDQQGNVAASKEEPRLFRTCTFSTYMTDYVPAIIREVTSLYQVDAVYTNGWPPLGSLPVCYCDNCRDLPPRGTPAYWAKFNDRVEYLWKFYDSLVKQKNPSCIYFANMGGGARASLNLDRFGKICDWFQGDNQGRGGEDAPAWLCSLQGRVCQAIQEGKTAVNVTGAWTTGPVRWRNVGKSAQEAQMWLSETSASGMIPYWHLVSAEKGQGVDRRELETPRKFFAWTAKHDAHFVNRRTIANVGVVMGQSTHLFYKPQPGANAQQFLNGMYYALLEGRILFDFVHEDRLDPERLRKYSALILPNVALLSEAQCQQLRDYVNAGGSLLATFETSLYDENNHPRENFGLADLFDIKKTGAIIPTNGNGYYARIERKHPIVDGFDGTEWLPGAEFRVPLAPVADAVLTVVPGFVAYPPELAYPPEPKTNVPAAVLREKGASRLAYIAGDVERSMWVAGNTDISRLLQNTVKWLLKEDQSVEIQGPGLIEAFAYETEPGFALHVLNYTNPNLHRGAIREFFPVGPQSVRFAVPADRAVSRVQLLKAETDIPFKRVKDGIEFTIPSVVEYEVAAIYT